MGGEASPGVARQVADVRQEVPAGQQAWLGETMDVAPPELAGPVKE